MVGTGENGFELVGAIVVSGVSTLITTVLATVGSTPSGATVVVVNLASFLVNATVLTGIVPEITCAGHSTPGK